MKYFSFKNITDLERDFHTQILKTLCSQSIDFRSYVLKSNHKEKSSDQYTRGWWRLGILQVLTAFAFVLNPSITDVLYYSKQFKHPKTNTEWIYDLWVPSFQKYRTFPKRKAVCKTVLLTTIMQLGFLNHSSKLISVHPIFFFATKF